MSEYVTYKLWDGCTAPSNLQTISGKLCGKRVYTAPKCDRDALLDIACDIEEDAEGGLEIYARRIREALGEPAS